MPQLYNPYPPTIKDFLRSRMEAMFDQPYPHGNAIPDTERHRLIEEGRMMGMVQVTRNPIDDDEMFEMLVVGNPMDEPPFPDDSTHFVLHHDFVIRNPMVIVVVGIIINVIITIAVTKYFINRERRRR